MESRLKSVALEFVDWNINGRDGATRQYAGRFCVVGRCAMSYSELVAFYDERSWKFYTTTQRFSKVTTKHEDAVREAILERVGAERVVVLADIWDGVKAARISGFDMTDWSCIYAD